MNLKLHTLPSKNLEGASNRAFRAFFEPDPYPYKNWEVGMTFTVVGVNRQTGEVQFSIEMNHHPIPQE